MAIKVYKEGYNIVIDATGHEQGQVKEKVYKVAAYCKFGFDSDTCWIKDLVDNSYIYNDLCDNMVYENGDIIGGKDAVENYLLGFVGSSLSTTPKVYTLAMMNQILHIDMPTEQFILTSEGDEIELMFENYLVNGAFIFGNNTGSRIQYGTGGTLALYNSAGVGLGNISGVPIVSELAKWTFKRTNGNVEMYINDVYFDAWIGVTGAIYMRYLNRYSSVEGNIILHYFAKKLGSGEKRYYWCNEGTGSKIAGTNGGVDADIGGYVDDSVWVEI